MALLTAHTFSVRKQFQGISLPSPFRLCADAFSSYLRRFFSFVFIVGIPTSLLFVLFVGVFGMAGAESARITPGILFSPAVFLGVVLFGTFVLLLQVWGVAAFLYALSSESVDPFWVSYARSFSKIGSLFWIFLLLYFSLIAGFTFFILPGIFLAVSFMFSSFVFFEGDDRGMNALTRSFLYVRGNWFGIFARFAFALFVGFALLVLFQFLLSLFLPLSLVRIFLSFIFLVFLCPFEFLYAFQLFLAVRNEKPRVREELLHSGLFAFIAFAGLIIVVVTPFITLRGAARFIPAVTEIFDVRQFFTFGLGGGMTSVRSGPKGEELFALQAIRDEKRLSDISTFVFAFDDISSRHPGFCDGKDGRVFKSTTLSGGGTNWLPINLGAEGIEGVLLTHTPRDPINTSLYHYAFACSSRGGYEMNVRLEGSANSSKAFLDNGTNNLIYEAGSDLTLIP